MDPNWKHRARQGALLLFALGLVTPLYAAAVEQLVYWRIGGLKDPAAISSIVGRIYDWCSIGWFCIGVLSIVGVWALTTEPDTPPNRKRLRWTARYSSLAGYLALWGVAVAAVAAGPLELFGATNPTLVRHLLSVPLATAATLLVLAYLGMLARRLKRPRLAVLSLVSATLYLIAEAGTLAALVVGPYGVGSTLTEFPMPEFFGIRGEVAVSLTRHLVDLLAGLTELVLLWRMGVALGEQQVAAPDS